MAEGFDLESFRASQAEVTHKPFPVKLGTEKVTTDDDGNDCDPYERDVIIHVPHQDDWTLEAQMKLGEGDLLTFITMLVGEDKLDLFFAHGWTTREFKALTDKMAESSGFQTGPTSQPPPGRGSTRPSS